MESLPATLQQVRAARRLSQLELALRLGVSQRHVSFVERGRARPSRGLLAAWLEALDAPLPVRNDAMLQAGYAPLYAARPLADPALATANRALEQLLSAHDPQPAMVLNAEWRIVRMNRGARWLALQLAPWLATAPPTDDLLALLAHPDGFLRRLRNPHEAVPPLLAMLRHDVTNTPALAPRVTAVEQAAAERLGQPVPPGRGGPPTAPTVTVRYATAAGELAFFSMFTTFGTPLDITLASLRVEHLFAADEATRRALDAVS